MFAIAELPPDEPERLRAVAALELLDTPEDREFDRFTRLAAADLECPIALVTLVDVNRQWFKSRHGLDTPETPRDRAFCAHAILGRRPMIVPDALEDPRFAANPLVLGPPHIRAYAGVPLLSRGHAVGTLCVIDTRPRELNARQIERLSDLAALVERDLQLRLAQRELERAHETFRGVTENLPMPLVFWRDRRILHANRAAAQLIGMADPQGLIGRRTDEFLSPDDQVEADARADLVLRVGQVAAERDFRIARPGAPDVIVSAVGVPVTFNAASAVATLMRDVTRLRDLEADSRRASERLAQERRVLEATLSSVRDGVALVSAERNLVYANPAYFALTGLKAGVSGYGLGDLAPHLAARSDHPDEVLAFFANPAERDLVNVPRVFEFARPERVVLERRVTAAAEVGELVIVWRDITAQYELERERTRLAHTDPLTQLLNRRGLEALLPRERARAHRTGARHAVVVLDIDRFKDLNDARGHLVGDRVLTAVAKAIVATCRATDLVARWGGEEFVLWLDGADGAAAVAERLRRTIAEAFPEGMSVTVSAGVAALTHPDEPLEDVLTRADQRLYEAKRLGRDRVVSGP